jgi:hypothetical protein
MGEQTHTTTFEAFVSAKNGKPFVQMTCSIGDKQVFQVNMPPDVVTALGLRALQAGIEAERDAGFVKFLREGMEMDPVAVGYMLSGLRDYRQQFDADAGSMRPLSDKYP